MKVLALFNMNGGVGRTSLVYHLAWMFADEGARVLAVDLDPQANLTATFLPEDRLMELWTAPSDRSPTILQALHPLIEGTADRAAPHLEPIHENLMLLPGDIGLAGLEDVFADAWTGSLAGNAAAWRTTTAIHRLLADASDGWADLTLLDMGSNLGAINRIGLIASDGICIPLPPDPLSLRSLSHLGPVLTRWRTEWAERIRKAPAAMAVPAGAITPLGYIAMQAGFQPPRAHAHTVYRAWMDRLPAAYGAAILAQQAGTAWPPLESDPNCLGQLRHYRSLLGIAGEAHKPIFHLTPVDGAIGAFVEAVRDCREDFRRLATRIANVGGVSFE